MNSLWGNIFKSKEEKEEGIFTILRKIPIFETLSKKELTSIKRILYRREYRENEHIFRVGEPGVGMYIIESGTVVIVNEPDKKVLAELHDGEFFGEMSLLDESPRSASAVAKTPCKILGFFQPDMFGLIERNPRAGVRVAMQAARVIGMRLRFANDQLVALQKELEKEKARS